MTDTRSKRRMPWRQQILHIICKAMNVQANCKEDWCFGADWSSCRKPQSYHDALARRASEAAA